MGQAESKNSARRRFALAWLVAALTLAVPQTASADLDAACENQEEDDQVCCHLGEIATLIDADERPREIRRLAARYACTSEDHRVFAEPFFATSEVEAVCRHLVTVLDQQSEADIDECIEELPKVRDECANGDALMECLANLQDEKALLGCFARCQ